MGFLGALPKAQQEVFLAEAEQGLHEQLRLVEEDCARRLPDDRVNYLMGRGALAALHARLEWIQAVAGEWSKGTLSQH